MPAVDLRYARALSSVVSNDNLNPSDIQLQLNSFCDLLAESHELREVLENSSIPESQKLKVIDKLASTLEMSGPARNFIAVIASHQRLHQLRDMIAAYVALADEESSISEVNVVSAHPMIQADREMLEQNISRLTGSQRLQATYTEDPALIGGAVVSIGSTIYDGSVRTQLRQLKMRLMEAAS